jgi:DNA-binding response OmpR family regulator
MGHEVEAAADGGKAWVALQREHFPVLITDWLMPGVSGLDLCRLLRGARDPRYTYAILLTGLTGKGNYLEGMEAGADDLLTKPFDADQLRARLRVAERILRLQDEVKQLSGLLPICSYCKRIRDEADRWVPVEHYVAGRSEASFSHGVCGLLLDKVRPKPMRVKPRKDEGSP